MQHDIIEAVKRLLDLDHPHHQHHDTSTSVVPQEPSRDTQQQPDTEHDVQHRQHDSNNVGMPHNWDVQYQTLLLALKSTHNNEQQHEEHKHHEMLFLQAVDAIDQAIHTTATPPTHTAALALLSRLLVDLQLPVHAALHTLLHALCTKTAAPPLHCALAQLTRAALAYAAGVGASSQCTQAHATQGSVSIHTAPVAHATVGDDEDDEDGSGSTASTVVATPQAQGYALRCGVCQQEVDKQPVHQYNTHTLVCTGHPLVPSAPLQPRALIL